jgi:hypothetical protein
MCVNLQRIVILSTQKIVIKLKNMCLGFGIRDPDPQQWWWLKYEAGGQFEILLYKVRYNISISVGLFHYSYDEQSY